MLVAVAAVFSWVRLAQAALVVVVMLAQMVEQQRKVAQPI
jgi:hypothetical protein